MLVLVHVSALVHSEFLPHSLSLSLQTYLSLAMLAHICLSLLLSGLLICPHGERRPSAVTFLLGLDNFSGRVLWSVIDVYRGQ